MDNRKGGAPDLGGALSSGFGGLLSGFGALPPLVSPPSDDELPAAGVEGFVGVPTVGCVLPGFSPFAVSSILGLVASVLAASWALALVASVLAASWVLALIASVLAASWALALVASALAASWALALAASAEALINSLSSSVSSPNISKDLNVVELIHELAKSKSKHSKPSLRLYASFSLKYYNERRKEITITMVTVHQHIYLP
uniref:Uncharacterized protein n=1 Tax=Glossina brevipalpis TaxID=37001 RepID=A0A1A9W7H2_9MUSC